MLLLLFFFIHSLTHLPLLASWMTWICIYWNVYDPMPKRVTEKSSSTKNNLTEKMEENEYCLKMKTLWQKPLLAKAASFSLSFISFFFLIRVCVCCKYIIWLVQLKHFYYFVNVNGTHRERKREKKKMKA